VPTRKTPWTMTVAALVMCCSIPVHAIEKDRFEKYLRRYDQNYQVVAFDGDRVRVLRSAAAEGRYEAGLRQKATMRYGELEVHHRIDVSLYTYADREARDAALTAWLDRFSVLGDPIEMNDNRKIVKSPPLFALVAERSVVVITARCETIGEEWERNIDDVKSIFGRPGDVTLRVGCGGPVQWGRLQETTPN